jgi:hypothetical protein
MITGFTVATSNAGSVEGVCALARSPVPMDVTAIAHTAQHANNKELPIPLLYISNLLLCARIFCEVSQDGLAHRQNGINPAKNL